MRTLTLSLALAAPVFAGDSKMADIAVPAPAPDGWEWSISAGPAVRDVGTLRTSVGSWPFAPPVFVPPPPDRPDIGSPTAIGDRTYDNGYVRRDGSTPQNGFTTAWGYQSASQVDGGELVYSASEFRYRYGFQQATGSPQAPGRDDLVGFAPHVQVDGLSPWKIGGMRVGFSAGFDFTRVDSEFRSGNVFGSGTVEKYRVNYEDRYDLAETDLPAAPYAGDPDSQGPVLPNLPISRTIDRVLVSSTTTVYSNEILRSMDLNVFSWTLGPSLHGTWGPWDVGLHGGVIANLYDWEGREETAGKETVNGKGGSTVSRSVAKSSRSEFEPGLYAQAEVSYQFSDRFSITGFGRYENGNDIRMRQGVTSYELDTGGLTGGLMLKWLLR